MKHYRLALPYVIAFALAMLVQLQSIAGEAVSTTVKTTDESGFFASPWVWIIAAAVFIVLLAAILNGGRRPE